MAQIGETELDIGALTRALLRRLWLLVLFAIVAAVATYAALRTVEPLYTADTGILIEERESPLTRARDQPPAGSAEFDESAIQSQVEVLRSRGIAEAVIDKLNLTRRPEFDPATRPSLVQSLMISLGLAEHPADESVRQRVMESFAERLSVYPLQRSRVIGVEFTAPDPELAAEVANSVAEAFVDLQQQAKRESAVAATAWLEREIDRLRERVEEAEQAVATYRRNNDLFIVEGGGATAGSLSTQQLSDINAELARARAARAEAEARADLVQSLLDEGAALDASQEVLNSQLIQRLRERQVALRAEIAELSTTLLPGHPRIRALEEQLGNLEGQIRDEVEKVLASLNTAARVASAREESLMASLDAAKLDVSRSNEGEIELRALEREAAAQRELLESMLSRYREAIARTDANYLPADARIISRAVAPADPSYPKKGMMTVAAAIAAFLIGAAIVMLREFASGRAYRVIGYGLFPPPEPNASKVPAAPPPSHPLASYQVEARRLERHDAAAAEDARPAASDAPDRETGQSVADDAAVPTVDAQPAPHAEPAAEELPGEPEPVEAPDTPLALAPTLPSTRADETVTPVSTAIAEAVHEPAGTAELADILADPSVRLALFAGAVGGEGAGDIAAATARQAARGNLRCILVDVGVRPSRALGVERPGLGDLLSGEAAFGEVIRRDEGSRVHVMPMGSVEGDPPLQRLQIVLGALAQTYDKVVVVADALADWPDEHMRPNVVAIVCGPETTEALRAQLYDEALARGAESALIVRYSRDDDVDHGEQSAAA